MGKKKSKGVIFWGWLFIVSGTTALLGPINPQYQIKLHGNVFFLFSLFLSAATLICGIFILKLNETARKAAIALSVISCILIPVYFMPILKQMNSADLLAKQKQRIVEQVKPEFQQKALEDLEKNRGLTQNVGLIIIVIMTMSLLILEFLPIYFFTRPKVKEQFKQ